MTLGIFYKKLGPQIFYTILSSDFSSIANRRTA